MVAGGERGAGLAETDAGADRQAAAEALGEGEHVGDDAFGLVREPRAGAADAGLDLVEHEERACLVAGPARGGQVAGRGRDHAAFALGRLEDDAGHLVVYGVREGVSVAVPTQRTSKPNGSNGARMDSFPVTARAPMVRPWKLWSAATRRAAPCPACGGRA